MQSLALRADAHPFVTRARSIRQLIQRHRLACFLVVTYGVTWSFWLSLAANGDDVGPQFAPRYLLGLLGPAIGALATTAITDGRSGVRMLAMRMLRVRVGRRWWLVALGLPFAVFGVSYALLVAAAQLPTWATLGQFSGFPTTNAAVLLILLFVVDGLGEETGWRGFLLPALRREHSSLVSSVMVAAYWAAWHAPAFLIIPTYRAMPIAMLPMFFLGLACGSVFLTWLYSRGGGSVALVASFHAAYNLFSGTPGARGVIAATESAVLVIIAVLLVIAEVRRSGSVSRHAVRCRRT